MTQWAFKKYSNKDRFQIRTNNTVNLHRSDEHFKLTVSHGIGCLCRRCYCLLNLWRRDNLWDKKHTKVTKRNKAQQTGVVFCFLKGGKGGGKEGSSHVTLRTDTIHIKKPKGLLQLILLYSIRKQIFCHHSQFSHVLQNTGELSIPRLSKSAFHNSKHTSYFLPYF